MSVLEELQKAINDVAATVGPAVVGVGQRWGIGSGVVTDSGQVLTNAHNVRDDRVEVTFLDGRTEEGRVSGADIDGDIATLAVDTGDSSPIAWAGSTPSVGEALFAVSNPGGRGLRVTLGFVSGTERSFRGPRGTRIAGSIEHTAPLLPGSSGGPIVDAEGRLLGINTNRLGSGFYLAIPADDALKDRVGSLARGEKPSRPRLGVAIAPAEVANGLRRAVGLPEVDGLLVRGVDSEGPAARAGIEEGDLIVMINGKPTASFDALADSLAAAKGTIELELVRGVDRRKASVAL